jgi:transposase
MRGNLGLFVGSADRARLAAIVADRNRAQKHVWRAQVVLLSANRVGTGEIVRQTGLSKPSVWRWQERYIEAGVDGLLRDKTRPSRVPALDQRTVAEVIRRTLEEPPPGEATHWTVRAMARASGVSPAKVHQIWQAAGTAIGASSCRPIRRLPPRSRMSSACTWLPPSMPSCSRSTRSRRFRPWIAPSRVCR